jgi:hypothetical protein
MSYNIERENIKMGLLVISIDRRVKESLTNPVYAFCNVCCESSGYYRFYIITRADKGFLPLRVQSI